MSEVGDRIRSARAGDGAALEALLESYRALLRVLARPALGDLPAAAAADASDVVQETLLKAHRGFPRFRGASEGELVAWLKSILARSVGDAYRKVTGRGSRPLPRQRSLEAMIDRSSRALHDCIHASGTSPSQRAGAREHERTLAAALDRLTAEHREVLTLRSLEGHEWAEVGERMRRSPDAARVMWGRALRALGRLLDDPS